MSSIDTPSNTSTVIPAPLVEDMAVEGTFPHPSPALDAVTCRKNSTPSVLSRLRLDSSPRHNSTSASRSVISLDSGYLSYKDSQTASSTRDSSTSSSQHTNDADSLKLLDYEVGSVTSFTNSATSDSSEAPDSDDEDTGPYEPPDEQGDAELRLLWAEKLDIRVKHLTKPEQLQDRRNIIALAFDKVQQVHDWDNYILFRTTWMYAHPEDLSLWETPEREHKRDAVLEREAMQETFEYNGEDFVVAEVQKQHFGDWNWGQQSPARGVLEEGPMGEVIDATPEPPSGCSSWAEVDQHPSRRRRAAPIADQASAA